MKLIVGLGNYGEEYSHTRHNTGFLVMDKIAEKLNVTINKKEFTALTGKTIYKSQQVLLMKPLTYMNASGDAIIQAVNYYHIDVNNDLLVIYDDLDLPYGKLRLRKDGSAGGHNGIKSIIAQIKTQQFKRIRVGISKNKLIETVDYVLGKVEKEFIEQYNQSLEKASLAALDFIDKDFEQVMNQYNRQEETSSKNQNIISDKS